MSQQHHNCISNQADSVQLALQFHDYWVIGSGGSANKPWLDEEVEKDSHDLPYYPGRALKGILRDAVRCAQAWGWLAPAPQLTLANGQKLADWTVALFGTSNLEQPGLSPDQSLAGTLLIGDARLPALEADYLRQHEDLKALLQRAIFSTAVNQQGTALDKSLRGMEVSVPMTLHAQISASPGAPSNWQLVLQCALPLVRAMGKRRTRGFGRVSVRLLAGSEPQELHTPQVGTHADLASGAGAKGQA